MLIGELEKASGLSRDTIRFYERIGLISRPTRRANGYREYCQHTVAELRFIRRARALGFALDDIRIAIPMLKEPPARCAILAGKIAEKRAALLIEIEAAQEKLRALDGLMARFGSER